MCVCVMTKNLFYMCEIKKQKSLCLVDWLIF